MEWSQSLLVLSDCGTMDYTVQGFLQAKILEWVAFPFSRGSSQPRDWTQVSCIAGGFFTSWATGEAHTKGKTFVYQAFVNYLGLRSRTFDFFLNQIL